MRGELQEEDEDDDDDDDDDEEEEVEDAEVGPRQRWTMTGKQKYGRDGLSAAGVLFYDKIHLSKKETVFEEEGWVDLWRRFWEREKINHIKEKKGAGKATKRWPAESRGENVGGSLFDEGDEVFDKDRGWEIGVYFL